MIDPHRSASSLFQRLRCWWDTRRHGRVLGHTNNGERWLRQHQDGFSRRVSYPYRDGERDAEKATPGRFYGGGNTIHRTTYLHVETSRDGTVVAVWFRCQPLPFLQMTVDAARDAEMLAANRAHQEIQLLGVQISDPPHH